MAIKAPKIETKDFDKKTVTKSSHDTIPKHDDRIKDSAFEEKKADKESRLEIARRIFQQASTQMNGFRLRNAVINRIAKPGDDPEQEFKDMEEELR